ncbi:hypothetical protein [Iodobacter ciconiae]|uniref:Uncharacterized protein n=1 Tax=Iodobacter ciconiae TaxID=2496266 RepID=A0A3S8ZSS5_9NEIS|nr:hypothetical protein [Iodobacter ciconiae]AZN36471.1 hypothetical protein EJO50_08175 [Iodobacter ciconiae]
MHSIRSAIGSLFGISGTKAAASVSGEASHKSKNVSMGRIVAVCDHTSVLSTKYLSDCSALAVCSGWNGAVYESRTLMHLTGSALDYGLIEFDVYKLLFQVKTHLKGGDKVIWVAGLDCQSNLRMGINIAQMSRTKNQPILELLQMNGIEVEIAGSDAVTIFPDGSFRLGEGVDSRGVLSQQDKEALFAVINE